VDEIAGDASALQKRVTRHHLDLRRSTAQSEQRLIAGRVESKLTAAHRGLKVRARQPRSSKGG